MTTEKKDGGPAFPTEAFDNSMRAFPAGYHGMTLRDYFAGQALAGLLPEYDYDPPDAEEIASRSYGLADAMLEARKR